MRAAVFQEPGAPLVIETVEDPTPMARHVVIRVGRCGICGSDLTMTSGAGAIQTSPGNVLGHEVAGEVVALGADIERVRVGDHVTALAIPSCGRCHPCRSGRPQWCEGDEKLLGVGGFAEYAAISEPQLVKLPRGLSWSDGALVEPLAVGLHGVGLAGVRPGARVIVLGAGPIALGAAFWARRRGARDVVVVATSRAREQFAVRLGATRFFATGNGAPTGLVDDLGGPADIVIEAAGAPGTIETAMQLCKPTGTVVVLGWCTVPDSYVPALYLMKEIRLQFSMTYDVAEFEHVIATLERGGEPLDAMVSATVTLDELPTMFEELRGAHMHCKVLIDPGVA